VFANVQAIARVRDSHHGANGARGHERLLVLAKAGVQLP
jgi:hypothetical protein